MVNLWSLLENPASQPPSPTPDTALRPPPPAPATESQPPQPALATEPSPPPLAAVTEPQPGTEGATLEVGDGRPSKKAKVCASKGPGMSSRQGGGGPDRRVAGKGPHPVSVLGLCRLPAGDGEPFLARLVGEIPRGEPREPLVAHWEGVFRGDRVWAGGDPSAAFLRGALHPDLARDLYTLTSETLLNKSAQSLVWGLHYATALMDRVRDAGRTVGDLICRNAELSHQMAEIQAKNGPEVVAAAEERASGFEAEVVRLRSELEASQEANDAMKEANGELQKLIRIERTELRLVKAEASALSRDKKGFGGIGGGNPASTSEG
ncbi:uncharacterized protein LOC135624290 isoform X2 [Musa acuminata AAA Group]